MDKSHNQINIYCQFAIGESAFGAAYLQNETFGFEENRTTVKRSKVNSIR